MSRASTGCGSPGKAGKASSDHADTLKQQGDLSFKDYYHQETVKRALFHEPPYTRPVRTVVHLHYVPVDKCERAGVGAMAHLSLLDSAILCINLV